MNGTSEERATTTVSSPKATCHDAHRHAAGGRDHLAEVLSVSSKMPALLRSQRSIVPVRRIFFCRSRTP